MNHFFDISGIEQMCQKILIELNTSIKQSQLAVPNGIATLNENGKLVQMPTAADVGAISTTGGTMTGKLHINVYDGTMSSPFTFDAGEVGAVAPFRIYKGISDGGWWGAGLAISGSGTTLIGGGESAFNMANILIGDENRHIGLKEDLYLMSDDVIYLCTNCGNINTEGESSISKIAIDRSGNITTPAGPLLPVNKRNLTVTASKGITLGDQTHITEVTIGNILGFIQGTLQIVAVDVDAVDAKISFDSTFVYNIGDSHGVMNGTNTSKVFEFIIIGDTGKSFILINPSTGKQYKSDLPTGNLEFSLFSVTP